MCVFVCVCLQYEEREKKTYKCLLLIYTTVLNHWPWLRLLHFGLKKTWECFGVGLDWACYQ